MTKTFVHLSLQGAASQGASVLVFDDDTGRPGQRDAAVQRFKETQGAPPPGVKMLNRWHRADGDGGLTIAESNDPQAIYKWAYQWGDVMELDAHPIIDDAEAAKVLFG
jgi:hypothetical protein